MYSVSIDGQDHEASRPRKIPPSSSLLWARNLRHYIGSGSGLGSKALMGVNDLGRLRLKILFRSLWVIHDRGVIHVGMDYTFLDPSGNLRQRILLNIFKEKQQKSAEAGTIPSFYKKKQSDLLLNADDLDAMWVCFKENCVIDDATGAEKMCAVSGPMTIERIFSKKRENRKKNDRRTEFTVRHVFAVSREFAVSYRSRQPPLVQTYSSDKNNSTAVPESEEEVTDIEQAENWFSLTSAQRICELVTTVIVIVVAYSNQFSPADMFLALDKDMNGTLSKQELREYVDGTLTDIFIERGRSFCRASSFDEHVRHGKTGGGNAREMDFESCLDFVLALENKDTPEGLTYLFQCLDLHGRGYLTTANIHTLFRDVHQKWIEGGNYELCIEDVRDWDMVKPSDPLRITLAVITAALRCGDLREDEDEDKDSID
ncbi:hypothetical protein TEA_002440 [Camellia sinensis var. sinensis]|uniref:EF-hand domain-containing protein n=1 Tax=Camellia sinensis var. sinensis TaxID=542762 RepID=A0A4V6RYG8_CAMSN|nr:hypothetical protein TEA_002440 [Camellia sinensis var. sinensis]